jgi:hypothetical protein
VARDGRRLFAGDPRDVGLGILVGSRCLVDIGGTHLERYADALE